MKTIAITGTPGTGKTVLAKKLVKYLSHAKLIDVKKIINNNKLKESYDEKRRTYIVDVKKLNKCLMQYFKKIKNDKKSATFFVIFDSHLSHYLPSRYVNCCIVTTCSLKVLQKRLQKRGYDQAKVRENLDAEIFEIIYHEAKQLHKRVVKVDTTRSLGKNCNELSKAIIRLNKQFLNKL